GAGNVDVLDVAGGSGQEARVLAADDPVAEDAHRAAVTLSSRIRHRRVRFAPVGCASEGGWGGTRDTRASTLVGVTSAPAPGPARCRPPATRRPGCAARRSARSRTPSRRRASGTARPRPG